MRLQVSAGIFVYRMRDNVREYLILHYPHGHWDLPKGKLEQGETKEQAALRELHEETGIGATLCDDFQQDLTYFFKHDGQLIKKTVYYFIGQAKQGDIVLSDEHIGFEWLSYQDALERLTFDNSKEILQKVEEFMCV